MEPITQPTFVVSEERARKNIRRMAEKARASGVILRPHFKTHQSAEVGRWFRDSGVERITVSSVSMAEYFASHEWDDITVAFPVNLLEAERMNALAGKVHLGLLIDSAEVAHRLDGLLTRRAAMWIKVDTGYHRTGLPWDDPESITALARSIAGSRHLSFRGLLTHPGHAYHVTSKDGRVSLFTETAERLQAVKDSLPPDLREACRLSTGDTPTCTAVERFSGVDEVRPGNFVYFDVQQLLLGSCAEDEIAAAAVCPVVGVYPRRGEAVIYGGAVHLSKQAEVLPGGEEIHGYVVPWTGSSWGAVKAEQYVISVSQEHGILRYGGEVPVRPGDLVAVLPVHSCLTANLLKDRTRILRP